MKVFKKVFSVVIASAMLIAGSAFSANPTAYAAEAAASGGGNESAYVEWSATSVSGTNVFIKRSSQSSSAYVPVDAPLVRMITGSTARVDIPGLLGNTQYDIRVVPGSGSEFTTTVTTRAHDRSGYAHFKYTEGVGAYKDDGTLKDNAIVVYVTDANKNSVTVPGYSGTAGIGWILNNNPNLMSSITSQHPLVVRIIGKVNPPAGLTGYDSTENGGTKGDNGNMAIIKNAKNITIEGIGYDAQIYGWGLSFYHSASQTNGGKNYEISNLTFDDYPEDAVGIQGEMSGSNLTAPIQRVWVHNNTFLSGYCANPTESDKAAGDGSCDFKRGEFYTLSYNHFKDCKKTNLIGASDSNLQYHLTLHHNFWEDCGSRQPLVRQANIHVYNNYYYKTTDKAQDTRANTYLFSEANYFESCKNPYTTTSGAVIKAFGDVLYNCQQPSGMSVVVATTRGQQVSSNNRFANFDTNSSIFYYANSKSNVTRLTDATTAKAEVKAYSGVMKRGSQAPGNDSIISETPANPVAIPYAIDFANAPGVQLNTGRNVLGNIIFNLSKSYSGGGSTNSVTVKGQGAIFKLNAATNVTIKDGGGSYSIVLYNSNGIVLAAPQSGNSATAAVPAGVYVIQSSNTEKEAKLAAITIGNGGGTDPGDPGDPEDPDDPDDPDDPIVPPTNGSVAMGTYQLNSSFIPNKVSEVANFKFNLRSVDSSVIKLRSDNTIIFTVDGSCKLDTSLTGRGIKVTSSNGTIGFNGQSGRSITTGTGAVTLTLTAGTYTISGADAGNNTTLSQIRLYK